jgi:uncharacterized membrane protein
MKKLFTVLAVGLFFVPQLIFAQTTGQTTAELDAIQERLDEIGTEIQATADRFNVETIDTKGRVIEILEHYEQNGNPQIKMRVEADGEEYTIDTGEAYLEGLRYTIKEGDKVFIQVLKQDGQIVQTFLVDVVRWNALWIIGLLFILTIIAVGYWRGVSAIVGLSITLAVLFGYIVPSILNGGDAVLVTMIGSVIILAVNMHLSHGFNKPTLLAYLSTVIGVAMVYMFSTWFVRLADLSGMASEEAVLLYFQSEVVVVPTGILLAGIIIGAVGVLDDIAIAQSEAVAELIKANPELSRKDLFTRAMRLGRHHIASTVNTLVLAYAGVALPLLLLFVYSEGVDVARFLNEEPVVEEIVRTVAGTLALILTVPLATWFATFQQKR